MSTVSMSLNVNKEQATELMLYHLRCAAAFFENTHDDRGRFANELIQKDFNEIWGDAASAFIDVLCSKYEAMDK